MKMAIVDYMDDGKTDSGIQRMVYTIQLEEDRFIDVVIAGELKYVMQNHDGSTVFDSQRNSYPGYSYDENMAIEKAEKQHALLIYLSEIN